MPRSLDCHDGVTHFWCPQLGQPINFGYCRKMADGLPCSRVIQCFASHFDVEAFLQAHYSPEQRALIAAPPKSKLERIHEALDKAKREGPPDEG